MADIVVGHRVDLFGFEGLHEALRHGVVVRTAGAAHAGLDTGRLQTGDVANRGTRYLLTGIASLWLDWRGSWFRDLRAM
jgi:hypothetical protein